MTNKIIRERLIELSEDKYKEFSSNLLQNTHDMLGVRIPNIRKIAKQIVKGNWQSYLEKACKDYFEEILKYIKEFVG